MNGTRYICFVNNVDTMFEKTKDRKDLVNYLKSRFFKRNEKEQDQKKE